jgi:hypothetical protein
MEPGLVQHMLVQMHLDPGVVFAESRLVRLTGMFHIMAADVLPLTHAECMFHTQ